MLLFLWMMKNTMLKIPLYQTKKLLLALEYGVILSETAKNRKVNLTPEMVKKMEEIVSNEFKNHSASKVALDMIPNILAVFEPSAV